MSFRDIQFRTTRNECGIRWTIIKSSWNFTWQTIIANREHETWLNKIRILDHLNNQPTPRRKKIPIQVINPFFKRGVITSRLESRNEERLFKKIVSLKIDKRSNLFLLSIVSTKSNFPPSFLSKMFNFRKSSECKAYSARANREMVVTTQASTEFFHECVVYREIEPWECLDFINYLAIREQESKSRR